MVTPVSFDEAININPTDDPYIFSGTLHTNQWSIGQATHGGVLMTLCLKSGALGLEHYQRIVMKNESISWFPHPLSASFHFVRVAAYGKRYFQVQIQKASKNYAQAIITMRSEKDCSSDENVIVKCMAWYGDLNNKPNSWKHEAKNTKLDINTIVPYDKLRSLTAPEGLFLYQSVDIRLQGYPFEDVEIGWVKFKNNRPIDDVWSLIFASDALPPHPIVKLDFDEKAQHRKAKYWCPTMQFDLYLHELPLKGNDKVINTFQIVSAHNGIFEETCRVYDQNGKLLVSGRQYAGMLSFERASYKKDLQSKL